MKAPTLSLEKRLGIHLHEVMALCRQHTGTVRTITPLRGGNVSHVYAVSGDRGRVVLKVRGSSFARIPALHTDPALIGEERRSLQAFGTRMPGVFPQVLAFHGDAHAMVLADVFPDGRNYHQHLIERPATVEEMGQLGRTLRAIHRATRTTELPQRSHDRLREHTFDYLLRARNHPTLDQVCRDLPTLPGQQLILGDLAPKNLSLAEGGVAICDLDNVHRSWPLCDLAYFAAHLLIHHLARPAYLPATLKALTTGYSGTEPVTPAEESLIATVTAGVVLYRLEEGIVPYQTAQPPATAARFSRRVRRLLDADRLSLTDMVRAAGAPT